jgi:hypothetical protein
MADPKMPRLPVVKAPDSIWKSIEASLDNPLPARSRWQWIWWALIPATALLILVATWHPTRWAVIRTSGQLVQVESVRAGQWLQTDSSSSAEMQVGNIGTVKVEPNTRLRIVATRPNENRLSLEHGEIAATISAPPKLFFVETKSATAIDLGCQYRMKVDDAGNGLLNVTLGWVSFEWRGRESLVPAGARCWTSATAGPGTPYFEDAPTALITALAKFDFGKGGEASLDTILANARPRDTLTLWHLLSRVPAQLRPLVYDRMISFATPPAGVTREKALALDPPTLKIWKDELAWTW